MAVSPCKRVHYWRLIKACAVISVIYAVTGIFRLNFNRQKRLSVSKDVMDKGKLEQERRIKKIFGKSELTGKPYSLRHIESEATDFDTVTESDINDTTFVFTAKLNQMKSFKINEYPQKCNSTTIGNSCNQSSCLQLQLPRSVSSRVRQIIQPSHLQLTTVTKEVLSYMADQVRGYFDVIIVSAASSNHFGQAQAMLYNIHKNLFPHLNNFTFIYYDLGFSNKQRQFLTRICQCNLVDFPFHLFPNFVSFLKCYIWKPLIINAHISKANLVVWIDSSVRFYDNPLKIFRMLDQAKNVGLLIGRGTKRISHFTLTSMFHFFGDEACAYLQSLECQAAFVIFKNELFVKRAILQPWAACALSQDCMCSQVEKVVLQKLRKFCPINLENFYQYGICHRFDQSAISILLTKLYQEKINNVALDNIRDFVDLQRAEVMAYPSHTNA